MSDFVRDTIQNGPYEDLMVEEIMRFVQSICLNIIRPKLLGVQGNELLRLLINFWEKFSFSSKILTVIFRLLVF
jgi:hypothetical protein